VDAISPLSSPVNFVDYEFVDKKSATVSITTHAMHVQTPRLADAMRRLLL
jgi:hypothetical protein